MSRSGLSRTLDPEAGQQPQISSRLLSVVGRHHAVKAFPAAKQSLQRILPAGPNSKGPSFITAPTNGTLSNSSNEAAPAIPPMLPEVINVVAHVDLGCRALDLKAISDCARNTQLQVSAMECEA